MPGREIGLTGEIPESVELSAGKVSLHRQVLKSEIPKDYRYRMYDPYPKYGIPVGMVIEVYNEGTNGKVMSLWDWQAPWTTEPGLTNAMDLFDGISNTMKIQAFPDWETKYPAFAACVAQGEGWYLPSIEECYYHFRTNSWQTNTQLGYIAGAQRIDTWATYWTSTETNESNARKVYVLNGDSQPANKNSNFKVRAFYMF